MRDYQYVMDHCAGIDIVLREGVIGEVNNVGTGVEMTNRRTDPVTDAVSRTYRPEAAQNHARLPLDLPANARSLGAEVLEVGAYTELVQALETARQFASTVVIYCRVDRYHGVPGYGWWDVPVAEVSEMDSVRAAREEYEEARTRERYYLKPA